MAKNPIDGGSYNRDQKDYERLLEDLYSMYRDGVTLPPEYASFVQTDLLRFLIRLARYKFVARLLNPDDRVLEIGSGSGLGCIFLSQHCRHVTGIDVKTTEVEEARALSRRPNVEFLVADLFDLPEDRKYDAVISLDVIEHMPAERGRKLIQKKAGLLNDNGLLIVGSPSIYSYPYQGALSRASHVKCYDLPELKELVGKYVCRTISFSMNDEIVHTGHYKMAWYYFVIGFGRRTDR